VLIIFRFSGEGLLPALASVGDNKWIADRKR
jgi:hypothetical protein